MDKENRQINMFAYLSIVVVLYNHSIFLFIMTNENNKEEFNQHSLRTYILQLQT